MLFTAKLDQLLRPCRVERIIRFHRVSFYSLHARKYSSDNKVTKKKKFFPPWRILFFGSDAFAVTSLRKLCSKLRMDTLIDKLDVCTTYKVDFYKKHNAVYNFAIAEGLSLVEWPVNGKDVAREAYDLGVIVSFGHLIPKDVIEAFPLGILNVHGSLLPRWRGASPIVHAIMAGDTQTGVTVMKIKADKFDIGDIIKQYSVSISSVETTPQLTDRLAEIGANLLSDCLRDLPRCLDQAMVQVEDEVTYGKKISESLARVNWAKSTADDVYNQYRALNHVYPLTAYWRDIPVKLGEIEVVYERDGDGKIEPGRVHYHKKRKILAVACRKGRVIIGTFSVPGKKTMNGEQFNNGYVSKVGPDEKKFTMEPAAARDEEMREEKDSKRL